MRHDLAAAMLGFGVLGAFLSGCAHPDRAVTAAPTIEELPDLTRTGRTLPADVGIEGASEKPRVVLVRIPEIVLTPEEKEAVGETEPEYDPLALYQPPRGPEQGVLPFDVWLAPGVGEVGGADVGIGPSQDFPSTYGYAGRYAGVAMYDREISGGTRGFAATGAGSYALTAGPDVGIGLRRSGASHAQRPEP